MFSLSTSSDYDSEGSFDEMEDEEDEDGYEPPNKIHCARKPADVLAVKTTNLNDNVEFQFVIKDFPQNPSNCYAEEELSSNRAYHPELPELEWTMLVRPRNSLWFIQARIVVSGEEERLFRQRCGVGNRGLEMLNCGLTFFGDDGSIIKRLNLNGSVDHTPLLLRFDRGESRVIRLLLFKSPPRFSESSDLANIQAVQDSVLRADRSVLAKFEFEVKVPARSATWSTEGFVKNTLSLMSSGAGSDVVIKVGDASFPVHKAVLSAHSDGLRALCESGFAEDRSGSAEIGEFSAKTVKQMLEYLYTGKQPEEFGDVEKAMRLFRIADKYQILELKQNSESMVASLVALEKFCEVLRFADLHGSRVIKASCCEFFNKNKRSIVASVDWGALKREHPKLAMELLKKRSV